VKEVSKIPFQRLGNWSRHLSRFNIGGRLIVCFLVLILFMLVGSGMRFTELRLVRSQAEHLATLDEELIAVLRFQNSLSSFYARLNELAQGKNTDRFIAESDALRTQVMQEAARIEESFSRLPPELRGDPTVLTPLEAVQSELPSYLQSMNALASSGDWTALHFRLEQQIQPLEFLSSELVRNVDRQVATARTQAAENFHRAEQRIFLGNLLTGIVTLVVAAFLAFNVTRSITAPLADLVEGSKALACGDFHYQIPIRGNDELAHLSAVFNDTAGKLHSLYATLRNSEAYLAEAQRLSQTGSWAWDLATGDIRYWSEECYRVLGFDPLGPLPKFETFFQRIHLDDQATLREQFERATRDKADFEQDYRYVHPDRGVRDIHSVGHAVLGRSGELIEFVGTVIDITERKRAEEDLQQLVDFVPHLILVLGPDGEWIHANRVAREFTGLTLDARSEDVIGRAIHPGDAEEMRAACERGLSAKEPFEAEARMLGKDGVYRWFLFRYNPLLEQGHVRKWYASATEIESRKQEEERVRQENVRLEERTRIAQELHDTLLQNFVSASMQLGAALNRVSANSLVKPRLDRILQIMEEGIEQGRSAIQGLRRLDSRQFDLVLALSRVPQELAVPSDIDFRVVVGGMQRSLEPSIQHEIYRIGREALVNAFCHSGAKRVEFVLDYADRELRLQVRDNGCGIDPQVLSSGREGHWGLAGMRERATRIGGQLRISSSATGGTEIFLSIPSDATFQLSQAHYSS